jgi:hypothetical protein
MCDAGQCAIDMCTMPFADCDKDFSNGCELDTQSDANHCGGCNIACPPTKSHCVGGMCTTAATCQAIVTTQNMWGQPAKGVDLRAWTNSTLHYLGCNGNGCSAASFFCNDDPNAQTLEFGSTGTVRAVVDPDNKEGDKMPTNYSGCCSANAPLGVCNGPDASNNKINIDNAKALCNALGYQNGVLAASGPSNSCPEAHALTADGTKWSSDYVNSDGYGRHWKCSVFK